MLRQHARRGILALTGVLSTLMFVATPQVALAAEQGSIQINATSSDVTRYRAYQLFTAEVLPDGMATDIEYGGLVPLDGGTTQAIENGIILPALGLPYGTSAADAVSYMCSQWGSPMQSTHRILQPSDIGMGIVAQIESTDEFYRPPYRYLEPNTTYNDLDEGWWLIVNDPADMEPGFSATAPIFAVINHDSPVTITEKTSVPPTANKLVLDDSAAAGQYGVAADANVGQSLWFKLAGTVGSNISSFGDVAYPYEFRDDLGYGLQISQDELEGLHVTVDGQDVSPNDYTVGFDPHSHILSVSFSNLNDLGGIEVTEDSRIVVWYQAHLCQNGFRNPTYYSIRYKDNPSSEELTNSDLFAGPVVYAYAVRLDKVDKQNPSIHLPNAGFTIQAEENVSSVRWGSIVRKHESDLRILLPLIWSESSLPTDSTTLSVAHRIATEAQRQRYFTIDYSTGDVNGWTSEAQDLFSFFKTMQAEVNPSSVEEVLSDTCANQLYQALDVTDSQQRTWKNNIECFVPVIADQDALYVQVDGSLGSEPHVFRTNDNGIALSLGLDEGTYLINEVAAPAGYDTWDLPLRLRISRTFEADGLGNGSSDLFALNADLSGGESNTGAMATRVVSSDAATGDINVQVGDAKKLVLPITGLDGVTCMLVVGTVVILVSLAQIYWNSRRRKRQ